jgi:hypothetical protein
MADYRRYSVRAGMSGRMTVDVPLAAINNRGEKNAVLHYAFQKLMGEENLLRIDHNSVTRKILREELNSRYLVHRWEVFETFCQKVVYRPMHNVIK